MMKDVIISINSLFSFEEGEEQQMEFTTDGYYFYEDEVGCLSYEETEVTGLEGTRTSMIVMPDQAPSSTPRPSAAPPWASTPAASARTWG